MNFLVRLFAVAFHHVHKLMQLAAICIEARLHDKEEKRRRLLAASPD